MADHTVKNLALCLQLLAGLATTGMYFRLTSDLKLPHIFLFLPAGLVTLPFLTRFSGFFSDLSSRETVTGVLTGVTCSFLSVVGNDNKVQLLALSPWTDQYIPRWMVFLRCLELLFLPLLLSVILTTFLTTVQRIPTAAGLATAAATAFSVDFMMVTCVVMLRSDDIRGSEVIANILLLLAPFFLLSLMPLFRDKPRAWIFSLVLLFLLIYWQVIFLGGALWSWKKKSFPVPGCLAGLVYVFHSAHLDAEKLKYIWENYPGSLIPKTYQNSNNNRRQVSPPLYHNHLSGSVLWHSAAYGVERIALYRIFSDPHLKSDCVYACIVMCLFAFIMSKYMDGGKTRRMLMMTLLLWSFILVTMKAEMFKNSYAIEMVLGMSITCITDAL